MPTTPLLNEKELFRQIAAGDEDAFSTLFHALTDSLYSYILKITKSEVWAEELVQDLWTQVWQNREKLNTLDEPVAYLHRMARNRSLDWIRRNKLELKWQYYIQRNLDTDSTDTTAELIDHNQTNRLVEEAIRCLPEQRKRIFELKYRSGCSYEQIGTTLQLSKNTVRNQMVSALRSIREHLQQHGELVIVLLHFLLIW